MTVLSSKEWEERHELEIDGKAEAGEEGRKMG